MIYKQVKLKILKIQFFFFFGGEFAYYFLQP